MEGFVLGIDGGNTKTLALVARTDGVIVGYGRSGCGDIYGAASAETACEAIAAAATDALQRAGIEREELLAGTFSLAGADWPEDFSFLQAEMERRHFGHRITIVNDTLGALRAGSPDGTGVVVVCGTGTGTGARAPDGRIWHSSWWQQTQGSQELGKKALRAVYLAELGMGPATALTRRVLDYFQAGQVEEVLHRLTSRRDRPCFDPGKLARALLEEAARGDMAAESILREHGRSLGDYAIAAARQVGVEGTPFYLILAGSVLKAPPPILAEAIIERVQTTSPKARPLHSTHEPVAGAVFLSFESVGVYITERLLESLVSTLPSSGFFET